MKKSTSIIIASFLIVICTAVFLSPTQEAKAESDKVDLRPSIYRGVIKVEEPRGYDFSFPRPFNKAPVIVVSPVYSTGQPEPIAAVTKVTKNGFTARLVSSKDQSYVKGEIHWIALQRK